jgi:GDP-L-fucose synthase
MDNNFFNKKKIAITGASGFLGTNFIKELLSRNATLRVSTHKKPIQINDANIEILENIDLSNIDDCLKLVDGMDYVIHCGGNIAHPSTVPTDIQISIQNINVLGNILDACNQKKVEKFLDINSSTGYPDKRYPITEDEFWDDEPYKAYFGYGWMRRYREKLMEHVSRFSDTKIMLTRGTAIYGPHDNFDTKTCHVVPALINRVLSGENPFIAWGSPDVVRDFLYVEDVINAVLLVLEKGEPMRPYNIGMGKTITIGEILDSILRSTGKNPEVVWDNSKPTTIPFRMVSTERITKELGFVPKFSFDEGIDKTVDWYKKNYCDLKV